MSKLNNKGFAISTMLYGLFIILLLVITMLINVMSFNRKNSKEFVDGIVSYLEGSTKVGTLNANIENIIVNDTVDGKCYFEEDCDISFELKFNLPVIKTNNDFNSQILYDNNNRIQNYNVNYIDSKTYQYKITSMNLYNMNKNLAFATMTAGKNLVLKIGTDYMDEYGNKLDLENDTFIIAQIDTIDNGEPVFTIKQNSYGLTPGGQVYTKYEITKNRGKIFKFSSIKNAGYSIAAADFDNTKFTQAASNNDSFTINFTQIYGCHIPNTIETHENLLKLIERENYEINDKSNIEFKIKEIEDNSGIAHQAINELKNYKFETNCYFSRKYNTNYRPNAGLPYPCGRNNP